MPTVTGRFDRRRLFLGLLAAPVAAAAPGPVRLKLTTDLGSIVIELHGDRAPITVANFLACADQRLLEGGSFHRTVGPWNDNNPATISVVQGGLNRDDSPLPAIAHETTRMSGLRHIDGTISMARDAPGAAGSEFFICLGDNPALDFGGARNKDGQGFVAFGQVVAGIDIIRQIWRSPTALEAENAYILGQMVKKPIEIRSVRKFR